MANCVIDDVWEAPYFENEASLKQWIRKQNIYDGQKTRQLNTTIEVAGTAGDVDISIKDSVTITQIGKTETNLQVISSAADAGLEHAVITAHYLDQDGVQKTATIANATADMSGATDFDTPVTDFYCWDIDTYGLNCFTSSLAVGAGKTLSAGVAGTGYAEIAAAGTTGTKLKYLGVGTVYGRAELNHADGVGAVLTTTYTSPWGITPQSGSCTLGANSTDEVPFLDSNGFPVQYFYSPRTFSTSKASTVNCGNFLITDDNCANVDGTGSDVWAVIANLASNSAHTAYFVPNDGDVWLTSINVLNTVATNIVTYIALTYTPKDGIAKTINLDIPNNAKSELLDRPIPLEPLTAVTMTIKGNSSQNTVNVHIIEAVSA